MAILVKILPRALWEAAVRAGAFQGSALDIKDGFIHLSTTEQSLETARLHFAGQDDLMVVGFDEGAFGKALKWEASRGGQLFPHVYGVIDPALALWVKPLPWNGTMHVFPPELAS